MEEGTESLEVLEAQKAASSHTLEQFENQIAIAAELTPDKAIEMGLVYVTRELQESQIRLRIAEIKGDSKGKKKSQDSINEAQLIIDPAAEGNFAPLKDHLRAIGEWQLRFATGLLRLADTQGEEDTKKEAEVQRDQGHGFLRLIKNIPGHGKPFKLPDS